MTTLVHYHVLASFERFWLYYSRERGGVAAWAHRSPRPPPRPPHSLVHQHPTRRRPRIRGKTVVSIAPAILVASVSLVYVLQCCPWVLTWVAPPRCRHGAAMSLTRARFWNEGIQISHELGGTQRTMFILVAGDRINFPPDWDLIDTFAVATRRRPPLLKPLKRSREESVELTLVSLLDLVLTSVEYP